MQFEFNTKSIDNTTLKIYVEINEWGVFHIKILNDKTQNKTQPIQNTNRKTSVHERMAGRVEIKK